MKQLKKIINEADLGGVKWKNSPTVDGFRAKFVDSNGAKFGIDMGANPMEYAKKSDLKKLDTLWKSEETFSDFDDNGFVCSCFDFETMGRGNLDSSTISKVSEMFVEILADKFKSNRIQFVFFQSVRPVQKKIHSIVVPKLATKLGFQYKQIGSGWFVGKDIFK